MILCSIVLSIWISSIRIGVELVLQGHRGRQIFRNKNGQVAIILAVLVSALMTAGILELDRSQKEASALNRQMQVKALKSSLKMIRENLEFLLLDNTTWAANAADATNSGFLCLASPPNTCNPSDTPEFKMTYKDLGGQVLLSPSPQSGFNLAGQPCNEFMANASSDCIFHYQFVIKPFCVGAGSCLNPNFRIEGTLQIDRRRTGNLNTSAFDIAIHR
jgi:hypothetical protein